MQDSNFVAKVPHLGLTFETWHEANYYPITQKKNLSPNLLFLKTFTHTHFCHKLTHNLNNTKLDTHVAPHCKNTKPYHCCFTLQEENTSPPLQIANVKSYVHCSKSQINHFTIVVPNHKHKVSPPLPKETQDTRSNTNNYQFQ